MNEHAAHDQSLDDEGLRDRFDHPDALAPDAEERQWAMFAHLSMLSMYITGFGFIVGPIVVWLMKRDESAFVDECGREATNFAISCSIWLVASIAMAFTIVLLPVAFLIWIFGGLAATILCVIAGLKANQGEVYRYPLTLRLIA